MNRLLLIFAVLPVLYAQQPVDESQSQMQRELDAYRLILMDWGGLTKYGSDDAEISIHSNPDRVVFLGDEIIERWNFSSTESFRGKPYVNRGITRQTSAQMLVRFRQDVVDLQPKIVLIEAGSNDIASVMGPSSEAAIAGNFMSMVELAKAHNIGVILASVPPVCDCSRPLMARRPNRKIVSLNKWLEAYASQTGLVYLDFYSALAVNKQMNKDLTEDGLIPNAAGYRVLASLTDHAIQQARATGPAR